MVNDDNKLSSVFDKKFFNMEVYSHYKNNEWVSDPFIGFKLKKIKKIFNKKILLETNKLGLRTRDDIKKKKYEIIFLGGSFVFGSYSPTDNDTIPKYYENLSKKKTLNAGVGGHILKQHLSLYYNYLYKNHPNKIFLIFGFNDMVNCFNNKKPDNLRVEFFDEHLSMSFCSLLKLLILKIIKLIKIDFLFNFYKKIIFFFRGSRIVNNKKNEHSRINEYCNELAILLNSFNNFCITNKISLITILQPTLLLSNKKLNSYEENYMKKINTRKISFAKKFYEILAFKLSNFSNFYNYGNVYKHIKKGIFIDEVHTGDRGNLIFAKKLNTIIK